MIPGREIDLQRQPLANLDFFRIFMPYEVQLAQRRAMVWAMDGEHAAERLFIGLYLVRLQPHEGDLPTLDRGGAEVEEHLQGLLRLVLRDSDIAGVLSPYEHLAVARDIDPQQAYVVAQKILTSVAASEIVRGAGLKVRVGYLVYPLTTQPNFPPERWLELLELARRISDRGEASARAAGFGVLGGPRLDETPIPERDLVPLAFQDPDTLVKAGLLRLQRIHLLANP